MAKQVLNGNAFEFAIAQAFNQQLGCSIVMNPAFWVTENAFKEIDYQAKNHITQSAHAITTFIIQRDKRLNTATAIAIQGSGAGRHGDVRDLIIDCADGEFVGISAKHNHYAIKHPRLSGTIDFGKSWGDHPVSDNYWQKVRPIFADLAARAKNGEEFSQIPNKAAVVYLPVLSAFEDELRRLCEDYGQQFIRKFFQYLIGRNDFYKVICDKRESVIEAINLNGTLKWGSQWKIPKRIEGIRRMSGSETRLIVIFEDGWQVLFRLHNARKKVEPSLKFDVGFVGMSSKVSRITLSIQDVV